MAKKKEEPAVHAMLSASGSERWINCTPSARLEQQFGVDTKSIYADEGSLAHVLGEVSLKFIANMISSEEYFERINDIEANPLYTDDMLDEVEKYTSYVIDEWLQAKKETSDATLIVEQQFDLGDIIEEGKGTTDAAIIADRVLRVYDLKYGKGVRVSAVDNAQQKLYAFGAYSYFNMMYEFDTIEINIIQPRLDNFSTWIVSVKDLLAWVEEVVVPRAKLAFAGEGKVVAGDWCKFCKIKKRCKAFATSNLEIAKYEFKAPELLTDKEIADVLKRGPLFVNWVNGILEYAFEQALDGKKWPGYKLVEGRSVRSWLDKESVATNLIANGFKENDIYKTSLKGIGDIEKLVTKAKFNDIVGEWVVKPAGKPTLVDESDKRQEIGSAVTDFQ